MDNLIPIGVSVLSACLKKAGHKTKLFDTTFYKTSEKTGDEARVETLQVLPTDLSKFGIHKKNTNMAEDFKRAIREFNPEIIGFSAVESTYHITLDLLKEIKDLRIPKIVGGIHATMAGKEIIKNPNLDMICIGEGEEAIVELADRIGSGKEYSDVRNLWIKKSGKIIKNPLRPLVNLDELPDQDWSIYEKERFFKPMGGKIWISGPIELDRGCPFHCAFCCNDELQAKYKDIGKYPRQRSIENFINELKEKKEKYGLQYLYLVAENFLQMNRERFDKFVEQYKDIKLPFWIETRPETVNLERILKIKEIGCEGISIGVEHGNDEFRKDILNRYVSNEKVTEAFDLAKKAGIRVCANNIMGFPTETRELVFDTINLNRRLKAHNVIVNIFCAYRGTRLRELCVEKGYLPEDFIAGDYRSDAGLDMPQLSREQVKGLQRTFPLYVKFPKEMWTEIEKAEKFDKQGNNVFEKLSQIYKEKYM